jgi:hypothetical protein
VISGSKISLKCYICPEINSFLNTHCHEMWSQTNKQTNKQNKTKQNKNKKKEERERERELLGVCT